MNEYIYVIVSKIDVTSFYYTFSISLNLNLNPFFRQNGATCIDGANEYTCKCAGDFSGKFCEAGPAVFQQTSPCQQNDCQNGICFVPPNSQDYVCKCSPGFSGKHCEYLTRVRFSLENSFIALDGLKTKPSSNVTLSNDTFSKVTSSNAALSVMSFQLMSFYLKSLHLTSLHL